MSELNSGLNSDLYEETVTSQIHFQGQILNVRVDQVKLPDGNTTKREVVEHSGGVTIIPVTDAGEIILVKQYRKAADQVLLELPAGKLEPEEDPETCAGRELEEETGYRAGKLEKLFSFYTTPGYSDEILHLYLAGELVKSVTSMDDGEFIEIKKIKMEEIDKYINQGKIKDAKTIIGLQFLKAGNDYE